MALMRGGRRILLGPLFLGLALAGLPAAGSPFAGAPPAGKAEAAGSDDDRPVYARLFAQGIEAVRAGRRDEGMRLLKKVYGDFPDSPQAPQAMLKVAELIYPVSSWEQIGSASAAAVKEAGDLLAALPRTYRSSREAARALVKLGYLTMEPAGPKADLEAACEHFSTAAQVYPDSDAADDAYFGAGMCETLRARPARAAEAFGRLLDEQPTSPLAPQALYRLGVSLSHLDDATEAALTLQEVRNRYPNSRLAGRALERLTLIHRLRLFPPAPSQAAGAASQAAVRGLPPHDGSPYRLDEAYGAPVAARAANEAGIRGVSDIAIDPQGLAVVASPKAPGVFRLDARGRIQDRIAHPAPEHVAPADGLLVYISGREQIAVNGKHWAGADLKDDQGRAPVDFGPIAVDPGGRVYLLDRRGNAVQIFDRNKRLVGTVRPAAAKESRLVDLAAGEDGAVFVLDGRAKTVIELHQGKETNRIPLATLGLEEPVALAVDGLGDLFLLDGRTGSITVADPSGRRIAELRPPREVEARLGDATALAVDALGRLYLAGRKSAQVVRFR